MANSPAGAFKASGDKLLVGTAGAAASLVEDAVVTVTVEATDARDLTHTLVYLTMAWPYSSVLH